MKWIRMFSAVIALSGMMATVNAGLFGSGGCKSCGCAEDCQPACCKPTIARPCHTNVYTYQRKCSDIKPPCCNSCCAPASCCAPVDCCEDPCGNNGCCEATCAAPACCEDPSCCAPGACCDNACGAGACGTNGCCEATCAAPACCEDPTCCAPAACGNGCVADPSCCAPAACGDGCGTGCGECCNVNCCEIAQLIYESMTACYARDRRRAIHKLGDRYDCCCNPEIMNAFVYALNDADEDVRAKAADEIGDQIRKNRCCCSPCVVSALTCALADCDRAVRRQAEEALEACGYEVVDGCCGGCGDMCCATDPSCCAPGACGNGCAPAPAPAAAAPAEGDTEAVPAAVPPADPQAYFPSRLHRQQKSRSGLAGLFGLAR